MVDARTNSVVVVAVQPGEIGTLRNLLQLYQYDFSEIEPTAIDSDGRFHQLDDLEFDHGYFIKVDGALAGFALVNRQPSRVGAGDTVWWMSEFFILRRYRRASIGARAAHDVLNRHQGCWEITETPNNTVAIAFWRKVLGPYGYEEASYDDPVCGRRPIQRFTVSQSMEGDVDGPLRPRVTALGRREFLAATAAIVSSTRLLHAASTFRLVALGQSLILRNLAAQRLPGLAELRKNLAGADAVFSNLEGSIGHPGPPPTPLPAAPPIVAEPLVLESLRDLSINLLSLANNHSDDGGRQGFLDTIRETRSRGFAVAGTGQTLAEATAPAYLKTRNGTAALVAMASNALGPEAMATETTVGVNHVAVRGSTVDPADADRILASIAAAAAHADRVFVYQHDHYWPPDWQDTPEWKKAWCRACIDAGATAFISHGVPLLHGIEIYKGRPIFYGLGNFIFQLAIHLQGNLPAMYRETPVWQSVIAHCEFDGGTVRSITVDPISLKSDRGIGEGNYMLHGNPRLAAGQEATDILERLQALSRRLGTNITIAGGRGRVRL